MSSVARSLLLIAPLALVKGANHIVTVAGAGLVYTPNYITAAAGDTVEFQFAQGGHSVTQGYFGTPCTPPTDGSGFNSGFVENTTLPWVITVQNTDPIYYYCFVGEHCESGMVGGINTPTTGSETLAAYDTAAHNFQGLNGEPVSVQGGYFGYPSSSSSSSAPASTTTTSATTSSAPASTTSAPASSSASTSAYTSSSGSVSTTSASAYTSSTTSAASSSAQSTTCTTSGSASSSPVSPTSWSSGAVNGTTTTAWNTYTTITTSCSTSASLQPVIPSGTGYTSPPAFANATTPALPTYTGAAVVIAPVLAAIPVALLAAL